MCRRTAKVRGRVGAGRTVVAMLAVAPWRPRHLEDALRCATAARAVAVSNPGTATVSMAELRRKILPHASLTQKERSLEGPPSSTRSCRMA